MSDLKSPPYDIKTKNVANIQKFKSVSEHINQQSYKVTAI